jgi:hypothetical protein
MGSRAAFVPESNIAGALSRTDLTWLAGSLEFLSLRQSLVHYGIVDEASPSSFSRVVCHLTKFWTAKGLPDGTVPSAVIDSGVENVNGTVNEFVSDGTIQRILAQVDIVESNSMIEAWWRQLKH